MCVCVYAGPSHKGNRHPPNRRPQCPTINSLLITVQLWQSRSWFWIHLVNHSYGPTMQSAIPYIRSPSQIRGFAYTRRAIYQTIPDNGLGPFLHSFFLTLSHPVTVAARHPRPVFRVFFHCAQVTPPGPEHDTALLFAWAKNGANELCQDSSIGMLGWSRWARATFLHRLRRVILDGEPLTLSGRGWCYEKIFVSPRPRSGIVAARRGILILPS